MFLRSGSKCFRLSPFHLKDSDSPPFFPSTVFRQGLDGFDAQDSARVSEKLRCHHHWPQLEAWMFVMRSPITDTSGTINPLSLVTGDYNYSSHGFFSERKRRILSPRILCILKIVKSQKNRWFFSRIHLKNSKRPNTSKNEVSLCPPQKRAEQWL